MPRMNMPDQIHQKRGRSPKTTNLERIRNNQRRSRASKKAYVADLEAKIRRYETAETESATDYKVQQLIKENDTLKKLLLSLGLGNDFLAAYTNASGTAVEVLKSTGQAENQVRHVETSSCATEPLPSLTGKQDDDSTRALVESTIPNPLEAYLGVDVVDSSLQPEPENRSISFQLAEIVPWKPTADDTSYFSDIEATLPTYGPLAMTSMTAQTEDRVTALDNSKAPCKQEDTTLCSVAFSLIMTSNRKGYSAADLDLRLRAGYRYEYATLEECRIDNRILLRVLTDII